MFAKLYETEVGQILVKIDTDDKGAPEVRFFFEPEGLGVCSVAVSGDTDSDKSWDNVEAIFASVTMESALSVVSGIIGEFISQQ